MGNIVYNRAKTWQMAFFVCNNLATNVFLGLMFYVSYYAVGIAGLGVVGVSFLLTTMRIFDGITDPLIGYVIDKTETRFGKFRPMMLTGYIIMTISTLVMFNTVHLVPESIRFIYFAVIYSVYILGYTFQTACTKSGQATLTNDPAQRPTFSLYDGIYNTAFFAFLPYLVFNILIPKYTIGDLNGLNNVAFHQELLSIMLVLSGILTCIAIIGISQKDKKEFFGLGDKGTPVKFSDYIEVMKNNKALQMLIFAASTDKLASQIFGNASVVIIIFALTTGDPSIQGNIAGLIAIPQLILLAIGIRIASKLGQKQALVSSTWISIFLNLIVGAMILYGPMNTMSFTNVNMFTILFVGIYILAKGVGTVSGSIVIPMIADCADYETYRSGRYIPGMIGTLFSFIDKLVSSLATTVIGVTLAMIGFTHELPTTQTPLTPELLYVGVFLFIGMPIIGWICSLIAMKFYPLTYEKMEEIEEEIDKIKKTPLTPSMSNA